LDYRSADIDIGAANCGTTGNRGIISIKKETVNDYVIGFDGYKDLSKATSLIVGYIMARAASIIIITFSVVGSTQVDGFVYCNQFRIITCSHSNDIMVAHLIIRCRISNSCLYGAIFIPI